MLNLNLRMRYRLRLTLVLLVMLCMLHITAQNASHSLSDFLVTGRVSSQTGNLLAGVTVAEAGTSNITVTDNNGTYNIRVVSDNAILQFTSVGYQERQIQVKGKKILDVALEEVVTSENEVVVVGYGTQKKASVVGAITTVSPKQLQMTPSRSISNNLAGVVSGVLAVQRSGDPWNNNSDFWIRGISTLGNSNSRPLVLIDGIERPIHDIDPEEIESFSVLKDASASAVYGVRGANGVIMINTKRGKIGSPKVSVRFEKSFTAPTQLPDYVGSVKHLTILNEIYKNDGKPAPYVTDERLALYKNNKDPELYPDVNWWKVIAKDYASNMRANANVNGGNNFLRYALELGYFDEDGIFKRDTRQEWNSGLKVKRYNTRANVDVNLSPTTLLRVNLGGFLQTRVGPPLSNDEEAFFLATRVTPFAHAPQYATGELPRTFAMENPWAWVTQRGYVTWNNQRLESLASLEQDLKSLFDGLKVKLTFSFDKFSSNGVERVMNPTYYSPATARDANGKLLLSIQAQGQEFLGFNKLLDWGYQSIYGEGMLSYGKVFNSVHDINAMLLYNQRTLEQHRTDQDVQDMLPYRTQGIAGRFSYAYDRKYIAEFNFGYNGSENFAPGKKFGFFPSIAAGWVISEEKFMENIKGTISKLKIRGSWGKAGNSEIGGRRFAYISTIENTGGYRFGTVNRTGIMEGEIAVPNLTWETVTKSNIGFELGLWRSIDFQIDFFNEDRKDIFIRRYNIPGSAGFAKPIWANYGKVNNKGIDLSLNGSKQISQDWGISVLVNYTYAHNKILEQDEPVTIVGTTRSLTGKPINQLVGYVAEGLFTNADFNADGTLKTSIPTQSFSPKIYPGDIRYKDINGDGKITPLDITAIGGTSTPQVVYGFGSTINYKNIDFGFFFQGTGKTYFILGNRIFSSFDPNNPDRYSKTANWLPGETGGAQGNIFTNIDDRWTVENPGQDVFWPRLHSAYNSNNAQASTWWLKDMSFLRLRNVELGYRLSSTITKRAGMSNVRIFVRGANILTFSKFKLWDPELGSTDGTRYPIMKSYSAGLSINFL